MMKQSPRIPDPEQTDEQMMNIRGTTVAPTKCIRLSSKADTQYCLHEVSGIIKSVKVYRS